MLYVAQCPGIYKQGRLVTWVWDGDQVCLCGTGVGGGPGSVAAFPAPRSPTRGLWEVFVVESRKSCVVYIVWLLLEWLPPAHDAQSWGVSVHVFICLQGSGLFYAKIGAVGGKKVAKGWDCNTITDTHGLTALQWAAGARGLAMVQCLVEQLGAHIDRANKEGRTPLIWGCRNGHLELSKYLVSKRADIHATTKKGISCLHWVSAYSSQRSASDPPRHPTRRAAGVANFA